MRHLADGVLRRMYDEPLAIGAGCKHHYDDCSSCQARFQTVVTEARDATDLLSLPELKLSSELALGRLRRGIEASEAARPVTWRERLMARLRLRWCQAVRPMAAILVAAAVVGAFTASGIAQNLVKVFEPKQFQAIQVSPSDFNQAAAALDYGQLKWNPGPPELKPVSDAASAAATSGLPVLSPTALPRGVPSTVSYAVVSRATGSFTFDASRLRTSAARAHAHASPMPSAIDGSTLYVDAGPGLMEVYGGSPSVTGAQVGLPALVIMQTRTPTVYSTGATTSQLEDYLLAQPGMPPDLVAQVRAIQDPTTTLPVPIPAGLARTRQVQVQGVKGLLVDAGIVSGVVWQKNGVIYAVGGQVTPDLVLSIANSLH